MSVIHSIPVGGLHVVSAASSARFHGSYWSHITKKGKIVRNKAKIQAQHKDLSGKLEWEDDEEIYSIDSGWTVETLDDNNLEVIQIGMESDEDDEEDFDDDLNFTFRVLTLEEAKASSKSGFSTVSSMEDVDTEKELVRRVPRHLARKLAQQEKEAKIERDRLKTSTRRKEAARKKTHQKLKIISGTAAGKRLISPQGDQTRPMMELVRGAVFSMITSIHGSAASGKLPDTTRWLDLFAGTGAVGIEALSRGCREAHFVELSPWVVSNCLRPNLENCSVADGSVVHTSRVEDFLQRAVDTPRFAGGSFDFISVCPPYELVSYPEIFNLLEDGPFIHDTSIVLVEYPRKIARDIPEILGPLVKLRDRKYGRTLVALYGPE